MIESSQVPETGFENDRLTDIVLHKDDTPVIQNGEIINEPEDVEEKAIPVEENNPMSNICWFPIHFTYEGKEYTADVQKAETTHAEYHVSAVTPDVDHLPDPFVVAEHFSKEKFDFPVNETYYPAAFGLAVLKAITHNHCDKADVDKQVAVGF